jgi:hypothetical protein
MSSSWLPRSRAPKAATVGVCLALAACAGQPAFVEVGEVSGTPKVPFSAALAPPADVGAGAATQQPGAASRSVLVETRAATSLGMDAFTPNGRIQPRGRPTSYYFEYGPTSAYGASTAEDSLPPRLAAFYHESWDTLAGWQGGLDGVSLTQIASGGVSGGFVRYGTPGNIDINHSDGIGPNQLVQYMYPANWEGGEDVTNAAWGGGEPDLRGARISGYVRGNAWAPRGSELVFWLQSTPNLAQSYDPQTARWSNWAFTGFNLTDGLESGNWEKVEYQLVNDTNQWTYAGHYAEFGRPTYIYMPLDKALGRLNGDLFHMLVFVDYLPDPQGSIDVDELEIAYRNRSVLIPSNGGHLVTAPASDDDPARLTDGWRNGEGKTWKSESSPQGPVEITYALDRPVTIDAVQIHQNPDWPSRDVEVLVSEDGTTYTPLTQGEVPEAATAGSNFAFLLKRGLAATARHVKVRILSGYRPEHWGLGEIEIFGSGAVMQTDDDWYDVNTDITGLTAGATYHYRVVAVNDLGKTFGQDRTFTVPATRMPEVLTGPASRVRAATAKVEGRLNPLGVGAVFGEVSDYSFEYGVDTTYGQSSPPMYAGIATTPRTVTATLTDLVPGTTYHYRLTAVNEVGTSYGADATLVAK